uniref:Uncharacterized protein n=1 Tax=Plectus sambesii TaxID=2011161 RepID=A0A914VEA9_9BILA
MLLPATFLAFLVGLITPVNSIPRTFAVAPVEFGNSSAASITLRDAAMKIQTFWGNQNEGNSSIAPLEFETGVVNNEELVDTMPNAFIGTILLAYNKHLPLTLTPDDFWLLVSLGISQFLGQPDNAEKYRRTFVNHEGKMELVVDGVPLGVRPKSEANKDGWPKFVNAIVELIKQNTNGNTTEMMTANFTTTGLVESTVFQISLMEAMKNYFEYKVVLLCGIPQITLEGEEADYKSIITRIDSLIALLPDFEWYLKRVKGHMQKVLASHQGQPDNDWWRRMVRSVPEGSGGDSANVGWVSDFFPFVYDADGSVRQNDRNDADFDDFKSPVVTFTPVQMLDGLYTMKKYDMKLVGGFVGTAATETADGQLGVRPAIGWFTYYWKESPL